MKALRLFAVLLFTSASLAPIAASAASPTPQTAAAPDTAMPTLTTEQMVTATVHEAWLLSGKNEANFFQIVEQLAAISAQKRGITLPDDEAAGRKMGDYIKKKAKADTDQLLYAVVDQAVKTVGGKATMAAAK